MSLEYKYKTCNRAAELEVKEINTAKREVTFYAAAFDSKDSHGDIIQKGAFAKTIRENAQRFKWLNQHSTYQLVGRVLDIKEDDFGLLVTCKASETALGNDVLALEADRLYEHSIGYNTIVDGYDKVKGANILKELQLWEVSSVTWGSNPNTPTIGMKSMSPSEQSNYLLEKLSRLRKTLRTNKNLGDERVEMLELEVLQINQAIQDLFTQKSLDTKEPEIITTPELVVEPTYSDEELLDVFRKALAK